MKSHRICLLASGFALETVQVELYRRNFAETRGRCLLTRVGEISQPASLGFSGVDFGSSKPEDPYPSSTADRAGTGGTRLFCEYSDSQGVGGAFK